MYQSPGWCGFLLFWAQRRSLQELLVCERKGGIFSVIMHECCLLTRLWDVCCERIHACKWTIRKESGSKKGLKLKSANACGLLKDNGRREGKIGDLAAFFCSDVWRNHRKRFNLKICGNSKMLKWINRRISTKRSVSGFIPALGVSLNILSSRADLYFLVSARRKKNEWEKKRHSLKNQLLCNLIGLWSPM